MNLCFSVASAWILDYVSPGAEKREKRSIRSSGVSILVRPILWSPRRADRSRQVDPSYLDGFPNLKRVGEKIKQNPLVAGYLEVPRGGRGAPIFEVFLLMCTHVRGISDDVHPY